MATQPTITEEPEVKKTEPEVDPETGKFIYPYQPRDSEGKFIGKPYRFLYTDHMDLIRQMEEAKENADRTIYEIKIGKRKIVGEAAVKDPDWQPAPESTEEAERKGREEFRKRAEQEFGAPIEEVRKTLRQQRETAAITVAQNWALNKQADGYYPCKENAKKIGDWLREKQYAFTPANYDLAFEELKDTLVPTPPPEQPAITADSTQQQPTRAEIAPKSTGIIPGQFAGTRSPNNTEKRPLTKERFREIDKMTRDQWKSLQRVNSKEAQAFLTMKFGAQPQQ
jgi:hypothetical protein